ncbi:hypothetical protein F5879DRAFT_184224 [Lentinula edodes]|uniref:uncharacterized protein n=1 Tax=Lentinula edodes TaxID=5353 RepID=UPI001E8D0E1E|nr:uncharacterized protein C8R40DRAFT_794803 [Lentinula edodes]KAH7868912.1 hypothetical protein C8R40DRAFT_794803 [Lentinula edodes]KAJ3903021.1 hypothetical protein F5879DRAFT_184224 [Lentinula edodes]
MRFFLVFTSLLLSSVIAIPISIVTENRPARDESNGSLSVVARDVMQTIQAGGDRDPPRSRDVVEGDRERLPRNDRDNDVMGIIDDGGVRTRPRDSIMPKIQNGGDRQRPPRDLAIASIIEDGGERARPVRGESEI